MKLYDLGMGILVVVVALLAFSHVDKAFHNEEPRKLEGKLICKQKFTQNGEPVYSCEAEEPKDKNILRRR